MTRPVEEIKSEIRDLKKLMRVQGVGRKSVFNGGLSGDEYYYNNQLFKLETELKKANAK